MLRILNPDGLFPVCSHDGCDKLAEDGYCEATCCLGLNPRRAYCSEHSHRPSRVLEILGHSVNQQMFERDEVRQIVMSMWAGAGLVYESAGYFDMKRRIDIERARRAAMQQPEKDAG